MVQFFSGLSGDTSCYNVKAILRQGLDFWKTEHPLANFYNTHDSITPKICHNMPCIIRLHCSLLRLTRCNIERHN